MRPGGLLAALVLLSVPAALALPKYRAAAIVQFHYDKDEPLWQLDRRVMACSYCHVDDSGGAPWNAFGQAIQAQFKADAAAGRHSRFPDVLYALLESGGDADGDGHTDAQEVYARTLPGDPESHPKDPPEVVQAAFQAAGGLAQFAPPKR